MERKLEGKRILLIDHEAPWREAAGNVLASRKFLVRTSDAYTYSEPRCYVEGGPPDVVILGCASIRRDERRLIRDVVAHKRHLLILCAVMLGEETRPLFLAGADDVTDKPFSPGSLLHIVDETFAGREARDCFRERMLEK